VRRRDALVEIAVVDEGVGIAEADQDRVFERFYRVDPARSRDTGGTGLGLSIVKHVAADHGGDVSVWSQPGRGSTFTLRLPVADARQDDESAADDGAADATPDAASDPALAAAGGPPAPPSPPAPLSPPAPPNPPAPLSPPAPPSVPAPPSPDAPAGASAPTDPPRRGREPRTPPTPSRSTP
jgi:two-component system sensor histidine kinase SenX3